MIIHKKNYWTCFSREIDGILNSGNTYKYKIIGKNHDHSCSEDGLYLSKSTSVILLTATSIVQDSKGLFRTNKHCYSKGFTNYINWKLFLGNGKKIYRRNPIRIIATVISVSYFFFFLIYCFYPIEQQYLYFVLFE